MSISSMLPRKLLLWLSTIAALCLFLTPSIISSTLTVFTFGIAAIVLNQASQAKEINRFVKIGAIPLAGMIVYEGLKLFLSTWRSSETVNELAETFHFDSDAFVVMTGLLVGAVGFYALYFVSCRALSNTLIQVGKKLPEKEKSQMAINLKRNWFLPISATSFFLLYSHSNIEYLFSLLIAVFISVIIATQIKSFAFLVWKGRYAIHFVSCLTTIGICVFGRSAFYSSYSHFSKIGALEELLPIMDILSFTSYILAVFSSIFLYGLLLLFWQAMTKVFHKNKELIEASRLECIVYTAIVALSIVFMVTVFVRTDAFYGTKFFYDVIYTSDSPLLVKNNAYLNLTHSENDLRQPLFAVFSAPFIGAPFLIGKLLGGSSTVVAILMNSIQIIMFVFSNLVLAKMMRLNSRRRVCFMLLITATYTYGIFSLMMEQYVIAYFWLILCIYLYCKKVRPERFVLCAAGGTLLTSLVMLPLLSKKRLIEDLKGWISDMTSYGVEFAFLLLMFCRFDIIIKFFVNVNFLSRFTGQNVGVTNKTLQFVEFVRNCFVSPNAGVDYVCENHVAWLQKPVTDVSLIGVILLILTVISAVINWKKISARLFAGWVVFSVVMLLIFGWGTAENGLILYSLYFGWAYIALLFQLVEKIEETFRIPHLVPIVSVGAAGLLATFNIPAIIEMTRFAVEYYPV